MRERYVEVRELKAGLSECLRRVQNGSTIVITEHGRPIARLTPPTWTVEQRMRAMVRAGQAEWNGKRLSPAKPAARTKRGRSVAQTLIEERR